MILSKEFATDDKVRQFVRVSTSAWIDDRGIHIKKDIGTLKRRTDFDLLKEDALNIGAHDALKKIVNLDSIEDGVHEVVVLPGPIDYFSGCIEDWEYKLVPVAE